jgi:hypothetical protein
VRPLWACAHVPAFLQSSPFTSDLFRTTVRKLARLEQDQKVGRLNHINTFSALANQWLHYETAGARLRMAHRYVEWDGWEEGLIDSILGAEEQEEEWFRHFDLEEVNRVASPGTSGSSGNGVISVGARPEPKAFSRLPFTQEKAKVQMLNATGDICGGRGGELGRRLEAWLHVSENEIVPGKRWSLDDQDCEAG